MGRHFAVDLGAESGRCVMGQLVEGKLQMEELHRFPTGGLTIRGEIHWNIYRFYEEILVGLRRYVERYGSTLDSIGVDTWGVDYGLLNENGQLLELPYCYRDSRNDGTDAILEDEAGKWNIYQVGGIQFLTINTINQLVATRNENPQLLSQAKDILFIGDLLHYMLGAKPCCEYTVASITQLVDTKSKTWHKPLFSQLNLPELTTEIVFPGDCIGTLRGDIAKEVGLEGEVRLIAPAVHDTASAALATPAQGGNWAYISSGTWSLAGIELDAPVINGESYAMNVSNSGGAMGKSLFLKNVMGLWLVQQCRRIWCREHPDLTYGQIVELAQQAEPFAAFIDPDADLFLHPENMAEAICTYLEKTGQKRCNPGEIGTIARIIYESLALKYCAVFQRICQVVKKELDVLHIIGGGGKNALLNQFTTNAMGIPVTAGPYEGTVMGNLLLQCYGCGQVEDIHALRAIVCATEEISTYTPQNVAVWKQAYEDFSAICQKGNMV